MPLLCSALQTEYARYENGHYSYRIHRSPLCEYMINFIHKLKHLPEKYMMNSVLENFTILQVGISAVFIATWQHVSTMQEFTVESQSRFPFIAQHLIELSLPCVLHFKTIYGALEIVTYAEERQKNLRDLGKRKRKQKK